MNENEKVYSSEEKEMPQEINSGNEIKDMSSDEAVNDIEETVVADLHSAAGQDERNVRTMSKEELLDRLRKIVEEENVTSSKVVTALKQRFYFLRNAEIEAEMKAYMAAGNPVDAFAAMPDPLEVEFKDLLNTFKEKRSEYLASEEEKKVENLQFE